MATAQMKTVIRHLRRAALLQDGVDRTDGELLASFIDEKDESAFETLVRRHGRMVLSVCYRIVRNHHDAEDAFQATFLVLARKASSVRPRAMVANWLHGVACRTAMKAKTMTAKRRVRTNVTEMPELEAVPQDQWHDLQPLIDQELSGLPENYRLPIILCDLEGKSIKDATRQLGWPQGTLAGRLARARKMLAKRLTHRGVVLSGGVLATVLTANGASACLPMALAVSTTKAAVAIAAGQAASPSLVSAKVATLMEGVLKGMLLTKLKTVGVVLLALCVLAFGGGLLEHQRATGQPSNAQLEDANPKDRKPDGSIPDNGKKNDFRVEVIPGTQAQRFSVNTQEGVAEKPPTRKADSSKSLDEQRLHGEWIGKLDGGGRFSVCSLIFGPGKTVRRITENGADDTGTYSVDWSKKPLHLDLKLNIKMPATQTIMEFVEPGKIRIEIGAGDEARPKAFTDETIVLTRKEKHPPGSQQAKKDADRDIEVAEFYRRTGRFGSAHFYYQLVQFRYPNTDFAKKATQGLEDLKKHRTRFADGLEGWETPAQPGRPQPPPMIQDSPPVDRDVHELRQQVKALEGRLAALEHNGKPQLPAKSDRDAPAYGQEIQELRQQVKNLESRLAAIEANGKKKERSKVGTIIVVGNTKLASVIRKEMQLVPGQILDDKAVRTAEKNVAAFDATIEVIDTDDPGFKDILVRVKKK